jgi:hypothetical protein
VTGPILLAILGFGCGATLFYFLLEPRRVRLEALDRRLKRLDRDLRQEQEDLEDRSGRLRRERAAHEEDRVQFLAQRAEFSQRVITYNELLQENAILKTDLRNAATITSKQDYEHQLLVQRQDKIDRMANDIGQRYLKETLNWVSRSLTQSNYSSNKTRLQDAINRCRAVGVTVTKQQEKEYLDQLQREYELAVRAALEREEQARIKAQIREEQQREREIQRALEQADREKKLIEAALDRALRDAAGKHSEEISRLQEQLAEAEAKSQRTISQAQLTKAGNVYVISNIGSFGEGVFKIGMTRRLEPMERVHELGDASVPFPFDVHLMIATDNAPELEKALHKAFFRRQVNKVNPRKEFFRVSLDEIVRVVKQHHGEVTYQADAAALQYRESLTINLEDQEFVEEAFEKAAAKSPVGTLDEDS